MSRSRQAWARCANIHNFNRYQIGPVSRQNRRHPSFSVGSVHWLMCRVLQLVSLHAFFAHSKFQVEYSVSFRGERLFLELLREADGMVPGLEKMAFHS